MKIIKWLISLPILILILFHLYVYGSIISYRALAPNNTSFMRMRMNKLSETHPTINLDYRWVSYDKISVNLKQALIASEDAHFSEHSGFDWTGIRRAIQHNKNIGKIHAGGSTISQQLAKNLFLNENRSYFRKIEEAIITSMLEATTNKKRIYTIYLNIIEWGYGIYGAEAASQYFFQKPASQLTQIQAAQLAARVPRPLYYIEHPNDKGLYLKTNIILKRMPSAKLPSTPASTFQLNLGAQP